MTQLVIPPQLSHHHSQWHLKRLRVPENPWKGKTGSPRMLIRCIKAGSVLLGGLGLVFPKMPSKMGKTAKIWGFLSIIFSQHALFGRAAPWSPLPLPIPGMVYLLFCFFILYFKFDLFLCYLQFFSWGKWQMPQAEREQHQPRHCILGVKPDQVNHPHPWGKMGFSQPQRGK